MKRILLSVFAAVLLLSTGCAEANPPKAAPIPAAEPHYVEAVPVPAEAAAPAPDPGPQETGSSQKFRDGSIRTNGKALEVYNAAGKMIASNEAIIRAADEDGNCPSDGFNRIAVKGDYFTIEQQTCGGMYFMNEYATFHADKDGKIYLHKFSIVKTDRDDPDKAIPQRNLTTKEFGRIELKDVQFQKLYEML